MTPLKDKVDDQIDRSEFLEFPDNLRYPSSKFVGNEC